MANHNTSTYYFYQGDYLVSVWTVQTVKSFLRHEGHPLAEYSNGDRQPVLLVSDGGNSTVAACSSSATCAPINYNPYGEPDGAGTEKVHLLFNGELLFENLYLLGAGYRAFRPSLMRFDSPDENSPFGLGGLNAYSYCLADPVNFFDPDGQMPNRRMSLAPAGYKPLHPFQRARATPATPGPSRLGGSGHQARNRSQAQEGSLATARNRDRELANEAHRRYLGRLRKKQFRAGRVPQLQEKNRITATEATELRNWNNKNNASFKDMTKLESQSARNNVIRSREEGTPVMEMLRKHIETSHPGRPIFTRELRTITKSITTALSSIRKQATTLRLTVS